MKPTDSLRDRLEGAGIVVPERRRFRFVSATCCGAAQTHAVPVDSGPAKCIECEEPIE